MSVSNINLMLLEGRVVKVMFKDYTTLRLKFKLKLKRHVKKKKRHVKKEKWQNKKSKRKKSNQ